LIKVDIDLFIERIKESNTKKIIFTGTSTDPQLYKHDKQLVELIREKLPGKEIGTEGGSLIKYYTRSSHFDPHQWYLGYEKTGCIQHV